MAEMNPDSLADMDKFLQAVDEISSTVNDLASKDTDVAKRAIKKADELAEKLGAQSSKAFDSTVLNQEAFDALTRDSARRSYGPQGAAGEPDVNDQAAIMAALEADARERAERKAQDAQEAMELKEQGNDAFKSGKYKEAIELYTQGINKHKDSTALWTNRAQAHLAIGEYERAINDCDWALRVTENCVKAYFFMGKAYLSMKNFEKAVEVYRQGLKAVPTHETMLKACIHDAELAQKVEAAEAEAEKTLASGDWKSLSIVEILQRLQTDEQDPPYYLGGLHSLQGLLIEECDRTIFRMKDGLKLFDHPVIKKCLDDPRNYLKKPYLDMLVEFFNTMTIACIDSEENMLTILDMGTIGRKILTVTEQHQKEFIPVKGAILSLVNCLLNVDDLRVKVWKFFDPSRLVWSVLFSVNVRDISGKALTALIKFSEDKQFKDIVKYEMDEVASVFEKFLLNEMNNLKSISSCLSILGNMADDNSLCIEMCRRDRLYEGILNIMTANLATLDTLESQGVMTALMRLLTLMVRTAKSPILSKLAIIAHRSVDLAKCEIVDRSVRSLCLHTVSSIIGDNSGAVDKLVDEGFVVFVTGTCMGIDAVVATKLLAQVTAINPKSRQLFVDLPGCVKFILEMLKNSNHSIGGNVALVIINCLRVQDAKAKSTLSARLARTDVLERLLILARDGKTLAIQKNAAICIVKLRETDVRHIERLYKLNGMAILHMILKREEEEEQNQKRRMEEEEKRKALIDK